MRFEKLGKSTLKITLTMGELENCGICISEITDGGEKAKRFLSRLVLLGSAECEFCPNAEKFAVEVFLRSSICIIYISSIESANKKYSESIIMCKAASLADMAALCGAICAFDKSFACKTSLYSDKNNIILIAKCAPQAYQRLADICSEFGKARRISRIELANLSERYNILFEKCAAQSLKSMFKT